MQLFRIQRDSFLHSAHPTFYPPSAQVVFRGLITVTDYIRLNTVPAHFRNCCNFLDNFISKSHYFSSSAAAQTPRDSIAFATAQWRTADLGGGAECRYAQIDMFGSRQSISVATYPGRRFTTSIVHLDRRAESTSDLGKAAGAEIAVNGSYFNVKTFEPVTFVLLDRKIVGRTPPEETSRTNGVIAFKDRKGRRMEIFPCDTTQYADVARRYRSALAAGPVLIDGGKTFRDFIRVNKDSQKLIKKLIAEVSGVPVPIGPYEPKAVHRSATNAEESLRRLEQLGVDVSIEESAKPLRHR